MNGSAISAILIFVIRRVWQPTDSRASWSARPLMTVAIIPM